ncbi:cytochrome [Sesamum alatum]|uniref:Cytochrome n=1 Tax=Sesamum alatum TaxID=300844 RepID=A0AAE2CA27_9LAMI|nr:cytochrome [Sesamum alatum]
MGKEMVTAAEMVFSLVLGGFLLLVLRFCDALLLKPRRLRSRLGKQGIRGPEPSFLYGNIAEMKRIIEAQRPLVEKSAASEELVHAWPAIVFPHLEQWRQEYGPTFLFSTGNIQLLCITDLEMVKEVILCTSLNLGKPTYLSTERGPLLGRGILSSNGPYWAYQRKIIGPEFYLDRVKGMVNLMAESTSTMLRTWENRSESWEGKVEIRVDEDLRSLSADIISRACFGRSYTQGEKIFSKLHSLQMIMSKGNIGVPGLRYIPNKHNKEIWKLEHEIDSMILEVVKSRSDDDENKSDLLQSILSTAESYADNSDIPADISLNKFIVDNCKNIYFAGHETTAIAASWCLMTLAAYPDWQTRARKEVIEICGTNIPTANMLRNMKVLTMVIQETLRLYPPVAYVVREALKDIHFKGINIPKGINIQVPIPILHQHQELWGSDAHEFKPDRFANGTSGACKIPQAYMPFGVGSRTCVGQNFAMAELKVILSLILSKFSFTLSPAYHHSPVFRLVIQPQHGVSILLEKL